MASPLPCWLQMLIPWKTLLFQRNSSSARVLSQVLLVACSIPYLSRAKDKANLEKIRESLRDKKFWM